MVSSFGVDHARIQTDGAQSTEKPCVLDFHAAIHDDLEAGLAGTFRRSFVNHAELHPDDLGAGRDGFLDDSGNGRWLAKNSIFLARF